MKLLLKVTIILIVGIIQENVYAAVGVQTGHHAVQFVQQNIIRLLPQFYYKGQLRRVFQLKELPGVIIKHDYYTREQGAKLLQSVIDASKLDLLQVPNLWKCEIDDTQELQKYSKTNRVYVPLELCISEYLPESENQKKSLLQTQQLIKLLTHDEEHLYGDVHEGNLKITPLGKVGLIDTEKRGFYSNTKNNQLSTLNILLNCNKFDDDARLYLKNHIDEIRLKV